jgi:regulator of ribonuclease activity A
MTATADACDEQPDRAQACELQLRQFGGVRSFEGAISTVRCLEDNVLVKKRVSQPGHGRVLVVDGGGSLRCALLGDNVATLARDNGWAGVVLNGCVRDVAALAGLELGIKALGTSPRRSRKDGTGEVDIPVHFGGVTFEPGALLYGDDDGIVVVN